MRNRSWTRRDEILGFPGEFCKRRSKRRSVCIVPVRRKIRPGSRGRVPSVGGTRANSSSTRGRGAFRQSRSRVSEAKHRPRSLPIAHDGRRGPHGRAREPLPHLPPLPDPVLPRAHHALARRELGAGSRVRGRGEEETRAAPALAGPADASSEWGAAAARAARERCTALRKSGRSSPARTWWCDLLLLPALLVAYIALSNVEEQEVFDPYKVLNLPVGADAAAIKKAYRSLSLQYHPDKNPDPEAHKFVTESITPAYKTLTDETARENYEKYGHPDGKQSPKLGVALPQWMFGKDGTGPIVLIVLVAGGISPRSAPPPPRSSASTGTAAPRHLAPVAILLPHADETPPLAEAGPARPVRRGGVHPDPVQRGTEGQGQETVRDAQERVRYQGPQVQDAPRPILKAHALLLAQAYGNRRPTRASRGPEGGHETLPAPFQRRSRSPSPNPVKYSFMRPALSFRSSRSVTQRSPSARTGLGRSGWSSAAAPARGREDRGGLGRKNAASRPAATPGAAERAAALTAAALREPGDGRRDAPRVFPAPRRVHGDGGDRWGG